MIYAATKTTNTTVATNDSKVVTPFDARGGVWTVVVDVIKSVVPFGEILNTAIKQFIYLVSKQKLL